MSKTIKTRRAALLALGLGLLVALPGDAAAQRDTTCTYDACALRIDYTFFGGQHLVRGVAEERVAAISPLGDAVERALASDDSARVHAATFQDKYQWGSGMALAGSVIGTVPILLSGDDFSDVDIAFTITGYGIALVGGWLITSAMDDLNRALWWFNRQFTEER